MKEENSIIAGGEVTLNNTGYTTKYLDKYSQAFVDYSAKVSGPVMDVGCCFGVAVIPALKNGAKVIANDIEPKHLHELEKRVTEEEKSRLTCIPGGMPNGISLEENSVDAILCCRILHILKPDEIDKTLENIFKWLKPGGKAFLINDSQYARYSDRVINEFSETFAKRAKNGVKWPGWIENLKDYLDECYHEISPNHITLIDCESLANACQKLGFIVEKSEYFARPDYPENVQYDGRENSVVIVVKPK